MLKWILKKLGYVHHSELDHHHCNCCNLRLFWNLVSKYYDEAMLKQLENDTLIYGESMSVANTKEGANITWTRLSPEEAIKKARVTFKNLSRKGIKRGKKKK